MKISHELLFLEKQRVQVDDGDIQFMNENVTRYFMCVYAHKNKRTEVQRPCIQKVCMQGSLALQRATRVHYQMKFLICLLFHTHFYSHYNWPLMQKFNNRKQTNRNMRNSRNRGTNGFFLLEWSQKDRLVGDMTTHFLIQDA